jgi:hypothetical protein
MGNTSETAASRGSCSRWLPWYVLTTQSQTVATVNCGQTRMFGTPTSTRWLEHKSSQRQP